jgi:hypothetical protein
MRNRIVFAGTIAWRAGLGAVAVTRPRWLGTQLNGGRIPPLAVRLVALFGVRHLGEALVTAKTQSEPLARLVGGVDLVHGMTMAALAIASPRYRRLALIALAEATSVGLITSSSAPK